jgi:murein tripeptide amidase MpaA
MAMCHVTIIGRDRPHLVAIGKKLRVIVVGYAEDKRGAVVDAYMQENKIDWLKRQGCEVTLLERIEEHDRERQKQGRAALDTRLKRGRYGDVIGSGGYLGVEEVETALAFGERNHPGYTERIPLPHLTWEKRRCHALRIGKGQGKRRMTLCFISGVHGREWGGPDILIYFGIRLLRAYRDGTGVRLGKRFFTPAQIRSIVETRDIILFPQVNPDGRDFSMNRHPMWRKNRRPAPKGRSYRHIGVDVNRNFPFLWDFDRYFTPGTVASTRNPADYETYIGPRPASEPETRNVIWLLDRYPRIQYFVDVHSYGETILHSWGGDDNQSEDPGMNFANPAYHGKRGRLHDKDYREYIPAADEKLAQRMGRRMADTIEKVRGRKYRVQQSVGLYPTSGGSDDYAYSRHLLEPGRAKTIAYTVEFGRSRASTPFHPPYMEMRKVMREITAGLLELCLRAEPVDSA